MHRIGPTIILIVLALLGAGCAGKRDQDVQVSGKAGSQANASAEALKGSLDQFLDRIRTLTTNTAVRIQSKHPDNTVRRACLMWQIHVQEICLDTAYRPNLMVALVQTWYWTIAMERYIAVGNGNALFGNHQQEVVTAMGTLRQEGEALAARFIEPKPFASLKADIEAAAGNGELFTASSQARNAAMDKFLSATRLESVFSIVMSPFDALTGVSKGADSLETMTRIADRAVILAERYPQLIGLHLQMAAIEMQEQDAPARAFDDVHRLTLTGEQIGQTVRDLPAQLRSEAQKLLEASGPAQAEARTTLDKVRETGAALEKAATAIEKGVKSLDDFVAHARAGDGKPATEPSHPFDIREFTTAAAAIESLAKELRAVIADLEKGFEDPELNRRLAALVDGRLAVARQEGEKLVAQSRGEADRLLVQARTQADQLLVQTRTQADQLLATARADGAQLIDHLALRIAQLLGLAALLAATFVVILRRVRKAA